MNATGVRDSREGSGSTTVSASAVPTVGNVHDPSAAPNAGTISILDNGARADPTAVTEVTANTNILDPYLYQQFIVDSTFAWSKSDAIGRILWRRDVEPQSANEMIRYFTKLYNVWSGGLEYAVQIAGTGFNGGKLIIVKIPPNLKIESYSMSQLTMFPFFTIDPKESESINYAAQDQKIQKVHWNRAFDGEFGRISAYGGTIAVVVMLPLVTSSTGPDVVNLVVYNRLGADFTVAQLIPPTPNILTDVGFRDIKIPDAMYYRWYGLHAFDTMWVETKASIARCHYHRRMWGDSRAEIPWFHVTDHAWAKGGQYQVSTHAGDSIEDIGYNAELIDAAIGVSPQAGKTVANYVTSAYTSINLASSTTAVRYTLKATAEIGPPQYGVVQPVYFYFPEKYIKKLVPLQSNNPAGTIVAPFNEKLILFGTAADQEASGIVQPHFMSSYLLEYWNLHETKIPTMGILFELIDVNDQPLFFVRISSSAVMSCPPQDLVRKSFNLQMLQKFKFIRYIRDSERLPS